MKKATTSRKRGCKKARWNGKWYVARYTVTGEMASMPHQTPDAAMAEAMKSGFRRFERDCFGKLVERLVIESIR